MSPISTAPDTARGHHGQTAGPLAFGVVWYSPDDVADGWKSGDTSDLAPILSGVEGKSSDGGPQPVADYSKWIKRDPRVLGGKAVVIGTRIPVVLVVELASEGFDENAIIAKHPRLTRESIRAALHYARVFGDLVEKDRRHFLESD